MCYNNINTICNTLVCDCSFFLISFSVALTKDNNTTIHTDTHGEEHSPKTKCLWPSSKMKLNVIPNGIAYIKSRVVLGMIRNRCHTCETETSAKEDKTHIDRNEWERESEKPYIWYNFFVYVRIVCIYTAHTHRPMCASVNGNVKRKTKLRWIYRLADNFYYTTHVSLPKKFHFKTVYEWVERRMCVCVCLLAQFYSVKMDFPIQMPGNNLRRVVSVCENVCKIHVCHRFWLERWPIIGKYLAKYITSSVRQKWFFFLLWVVHLSQFGVRNLDFHLMHSNGQSVLGSTELSF